ncbi:hypothetical protein [Capsulimonas corticalis]|uniref:hypothetical protein n=1 Tax=Capsulimonas corticalis TaxID=2219043 RepID=UPI000E646CEC|nr:hypothetical protein [Capsulimonas corticalis]
MFEQRLRALIQALLLRGSRNKRLGLCLASGALVETSLSIHVASAVGMPVAMVVAMIWNVVDIGLKKDKKNKSNRFLSCSSKNDQ